MQPHVIEFCCGSNATPGLLDVDEEMPPGPLFASFQLHPAMTDALKKIYGYTSDGDGIRHALLKESDADAPLAKFMIVACSAFVSYVVEKTGGA